MTEGIRVVELVAAGLTEDEVKAGNGDGIRSRLDERQKPWEANERN
jgi:hypothetical protein